MAPELSGADHHQPGVIAFRLGAFQRLQLMQAPLLAGSRAFHRFSPWVSGIRCEAMAAWGKGRQRNLKGGRAIDGRAGVGEARRRLTIDLERQMGPKA